MSDPSSPGLSGDELSLARLEQELTTVTAELDEYQELIEELPSIYEGKFESQLRDVAQDIRQLLDERQALQQQIDRALQGGQEPEVLPATVAGSPAPPHDELPSRLSPARLALASVLTALVVAGGVAAFGLWSRGRDPQLAIPVEPAPAEPAATAPVAEEGVASADAALANAGSLRLRIKGTCWIEVQTLEGEILLRKLLQEGDERSLPLGEGLRLLVGRPDQLEVAVADDDFRPFGPIARIDWVVIRPPAAPEPAS